MDKLNTTIDRKFVESFEISDWEVESDTGWSDITHSNKTIPYEVYELITESGTTLLAADDHILIDSDSNEIFLKDSVGLSIKSVNGVDKVLSVTNLGYEVNMYDLSVNSDNHAYYTNGLLSHNTTVASGYLLWYAMFTEDSNILITSNKYDSAQDIMARVRFAYESIPDHIRAGVKTYNKRSLEFDNGSRIVATTTTENTGRGMSLSLVYCLDGDTTVTVRDKETLIEEHISLRDLYGRCAIGGNVIG